MHRKFVCLLFALCMCHGAAQSLRHWTLNSILASDLTLSNTTSGIICPETPEKKATTGFLLQFFFSAGLWYYGYTIGIIFFCFWFLPLLLSCLFCCVSCCQRILRQGENTNDNTEALGWVIGMCSLCWYCLYMVADIILSILIAVGNIQPANGCPAEVM